jgi:hypothetical protein
MRHPRIQHSGLKYSLDGVLGTLAMVRLIRVLICDINEPVSIAGAAKKAGLSQLGAKKSMDKLERSGIVKKIGDGHAPKFGPDNNNPFLPLLKDLFSQEQQRYGELKQELQQAVGIPEVLSAWMRETQVDSSIELGVTTGADSMSWIGPELRTQLSMVEKKFNIIVEINIFTRADAQEPPGDAILLWGGNGFKKNNQLYSSPAISGTTGRSLKMASAVAELIKSDSSLIQRAIHYTNALLREGQGTANDDISEWQQLLKSYSAERVRDLLVSKNSRAERLRRSSPFFAVLTADERDLVFQRMEKMS